MTTALTSALTPELSALAGVMAALAIGVVSPGPSFVMVARVAASASRAQGLAAALGMGLGGVVFALAALFGLQAALTTVPALYVILKLAGGLYLVYLGARIWGTARTPLANGADKVSNSADDADPAGARAPRPAEGSALRSAALGLATQISNPKTAIVYASVFAAFLPTAPGWGFGSALVLLVFIIETGWYAVVALLLSAEAPRRAYLRGKTFVDRVAGGVLVLLGLKLLLST